MNISIKTFLIGLIIPFFAVSQTHNWQRTNPGGGGAFSTVGASANGIIFAGSDLSGAYRSKDGGMSWDVIGVSNGLTETHISGIGFHKTDGNIIFLGTENGIFRSGDGGNTFSHVLHSGYITDIEFGTNNTGVGYAAYHPMYNSNQGVIYKSTDNGLSWTQVSTNLPLGLRILKIVVTPRNENTVYILSGNGRFACGPAEVYKSTDGGVTWINLTTSLPEILDIAIAPLTPDTLFITTMNADCDATYYWTDIEGSLYRSENGGSTWTYLSDYTGVIWLDPSNPHHIRLIDPREPYPWNPRAGTFSSLDGGFTFSKTGDIDNWDTFFQGNPYWCYGVSFNGISKTLGEDLSNNDTYYWVNSQWAFKTSDGGKTFQNIFTGEIRPGFWQSRGLDNVNTMDVAISPANPDIIYLAYFDIGLWRSLDGGQSWQSCNDSIYTGNWEGHGGNTATVLADPGRPNIVWASQSENQNGEYPTYLLKNDNTGEKNSWILANNGLPNEQIMGLSLDNNSNINKRTLYVTAQKDVYKSIDDGLSWSLVFDCNGCRFTAVDKFNGSIVYAGGENGLWRSTDRGDTWTNISHPGMTAPPGIDFWDWNYEGIFDVKTDPNRQGTVYVSVFGPGKGLYKSTDSGNSWTKILKDDFMRKVALVPAYPNLIYATSSSAFQSGGYDSASNGIWFSADSGRHWARENMNMAFPFAFAVDVDHSSTPKVFVGSPGTGFQKAEVPFIINVSGQEFFSNLKIFPNPASGKVHLKGNMENVNYIKVYNILGQDISSYIKILEHTNSEIIIDISKLSHGVYIIKTNNTANKIYKQRQ